MACGNTVAIPERAAPCSASFHQLKYWMPSRSILAAPNSIWEAHSSTVIRETISSARSLKLNVSSLYFSFTSQLLPFLLP